MFRLERRRQELPEDQKRLYSTVDEQSNPLSSAASAELEAIAAAAQGGEDFTVPELQDMISQYQAGNKVKGKRGVRKAAGTAQASGKGADLQGASPPLSTTQQSAPQDLQSADTQAADPQDLSSYKYDACMPAHDWRRCAYMSADGFATMLHSYLLSSHTCSHYSLALCTEVQRRHVCSCKLKL